MMNAADLVKADSYFFSDFSDLVILLSMTREKKNPNGISNTLKPNFLVKKFILSTALMSRLLTSSSFGYSAILNIIHFLNHKTELTFLKV